MFKRSSSSDSIDSITAELSRFSFRDKRTNGMEQVVEQVRVLQDQIAAITQQMTVLDRTPKVE